MSDLPDTVAQVRDALGDRFAIERVLGRGGMGAVYLARDRRLDRPVALKVLPPEFAAHAELRERFLRETRTAAGFSHPNIVPVFSIEEHGTLLAYAMGFVEGETLAELVARTGPLGVREAVRMLQDVGYALAYAHGRGVIHRDIKPDNIMIERATGRALLMDFGISRSVQAPLVARSGGGARATALTRIGEVVGTPEFMSPEQAAGDVIDGRSDLYSLGLVAWFALTGTSAMRGESTQKVLAKQLTEPVPALRSVRTDVPALLDEVVSRCVAKAPDERFATAEALVEALDVSALRGVEIPLPVRLVAQDLAQAGMVVGFGVIMLPLLLAVLRQQYPNADLDIVLPLVLFAAILWGRIAQSIRYARSVLARGFDVTAVQQGFRALLAEREAERLQLRADPRSVSRRRRQVVLFALLFLSTFGMVELVRRTMRVEISPGWHQVTRPGVVILYAATVIRGVTIVGLLRSPLRASAGERLFRWTWASLPGRLVLTLASVGIRAPRAATTVPPSGAATAADIVAVASPARATDTPATTSDAAAPRSLEQRIADLEAWRRLVERADH